MKFLLKLMSLFAWASLPELSDDDYRFSAKEREDLANLGYDEAAIASWEKDADKALRAHNADMAELEAARAELAGLKQDAGLTEDEIIKEGPDRGGGTGAAQETPKLSMAEELKTVRAELAKLKNENEILGTKDIPAPAAFKNVNMKNLVHSNTHFLGTGAQWDAVDRPWNAQAIAGSAVASTDWGDKKNLELLSGDAEHYARQNPTVIESLFRDVEGFPAHWRTRYDVSDRVVGASIVTGEVTQARKRGYLPKTKQAIKTEVGVVWPVNIDLTFKGYDLQQIETSWLNSWNKEGTSPFKMSFVMFLLVEISKQARLEDRIAAIKGIYSPIPETLEVPGKAVERMNGLLKLLWDGIYVDNKVKALNFSEPTSANILDHVKSVIERSLKEEVINEPDLYYYLSPSHMVWYKEAYRNRFATDMDFMKQDVITVMDRPNIKLCVLRDLEGSNCHIITFEKNIEPMENRANEKSIYRFDMDKRDLNVFADYKTGIRFLQLGTKVEDGDPASFKVQSVWTNGQPPFPKNHNVTVYDDTTGILNVPYEDVRVMSAWATDITDITGGYPGMVLKLRGNSAALASVAVKDNAKLDLASDFVLRQDATLYLIKKADGTWKEVKRATNTPASPEGTPKTFTGTAIDSNDAATFNYVGTSTQTLGSILNPVEGRKLKVVQTVTGAGTALTIASVGGNISVATTAVLDTAGDFVEFTVIDGVFTETNRTIA